MGEQRKQRIQRLRVVYSAVAGISVVILSSFIKPGGDLGSAFWVNLSFVCFAISVPALAGAIYVLTIETNYDDDPDWAFRLQSRNLPYPVTWPWGPSMMAVGALGIFSAYTGILILVFSINVIAGFLFLTASIFTFVVARRHERRRGEQTSEKLENAQEEAHSRAELDDDAESDGAAELDGDV